MLEGLGVKSTPEDCQIKIWSQPEIKWIVAIPKGGNFQIHSDSDFSRWQRFWIRIIGWEIECTTK